MLYAFFTNKSMNGKSKITEADEMYYSLEEGSEKELEEMAKEQGKKFIQLYERVEIGDEAEYHFVATTEVY